MRVNDQATDAYVMLVSDEVAAMPCTGAFKSRPDSGAV
jgi:hypothetical protein